jgi:hypothetical protein
VVGGVVGGPVHGCDISIYSNCLEDGHTGISGLSVEDGVGGVSSLPFSTNSSGGLGSGGVNITTLEGSGGGSLLGGLLLDLLGVSVEEEIGESVPLSSGDGSLESEDLSGEEVPHQTDRVSGLVVGGDGDVNELEVGVSVTEGNDAVISSTLDWDIKRTYGMLT